MAVARQHRPPGEVPTTILAAPGRPVARGRLAAAGTRHPAVAIDGRDTAMVASRRGPTTGRNLATDAARWWVLDPTDDAACVRGLLALHDLAAGRVVCHPRPGASWAVLVEDLLRALGKHPQALSRERRTRDGPQLLGVWLRAEQVRHLVVLRAHRLAPAALTELVNHAPAGCTVWLVWHHHDPPPTPHPSIQWAHALTVLRAYQANPPQRGDPYAETFTAARAEARAWRPEPHRLGWRVPRWEHAWPGCDRGALLQRLTIDAADTGDLRLRLRAARDGFAAEGRVLALPDLVSDQLRLLGPRLGPSTITRLRRLVCPRAAAAVMLGLATDAEAPFLARGLRACRCDTARITLLAGDYRVPDRARPLLAAVLDTHPDPEPIQSLLAPPGAGLISPQRVGHLVRRGAALADLATPPAGRPRYGINPATPFAGAIATAIAVTTPDDPALAAPAS